jgi:hypothetical protein
MNNLIKITIAKIIIKLNINILLYKHDRTFISTLAKNLRKDNIKKDMSIISSIKQTLWNRGNKDISFTIVDKYFYLIFPEDYLEHNNIKINR